MISRDEKDEKWALNNWVICTVYYVEDDLFDIHREGACLTE